MKKAHKKPSVMRRTSRFFCNDVNAGKAIVVRDFLHQCHDVTPYFVDLFVYRGSEACQAVSPGNVSPAVE